MTGNEQRMYSDITSIAESLTKIAKALENKTPKLNNLVEESTILMRNSSVKAKVDTIISSIKDIDIDGETMEFILKEVGMEEQMQRQLTPGVTNEEADEDAKQQLTNPKFSKYDSVTIEKACEQWQDESSDGPIKRAAKAYRESMELYKRLLKSPNQYFCAQHIHPTIKKLKTNKDCILDYVENYFGSKGARYTDIIKFAYYLNPSNNNFTYTNANRGYYAAGFNRRIETNGWLVKGGKDYLVKGINSKNQERYFTFNKVDSHTEFWKKVEYTRKRYSYGGGRKNMFFLTKVTDKI